MDEKERALDFLSRSAQAIAATFGNCCETLIHDFSKPGHPIVAIYNGHVSGRGVGSTADIFGADLGEAEQNKEWVNTMEDAVNTFAITNSGKYIKSTSIHYRGNNFHYVLGINFDYTYLVPAQSILSDLTSTGESLEEHVSSNRQKSLEDIFDICVSRIGKATKDMKKSDRLQLITLLMEENAFEFQKAVSYVANRLNTSRYTIYKYIHEIEDQTSSN